MPSLDPHTDDVLEYFTKQEHVSCSSKRPLTSIDQDFKTNKVRLVLHEDLKSHYLWFYQSHLKCCYQEITRSGVNETADEEFK